MQMTILASDPFFFPPLLLSEVTQLGQLIEQLLQVPIGDLILETGNKGLGFLGIVTAQTP